jgi:hypothetical protein
MPATLNSTMATFVDDTAVMAIGETAENSTRKLQSSVNKVTMWTREWQIKLRESKSLHIDFTYKKFRQQPVISGTQVPYANTAKYLGMTLDAKLRWNIKFRIKYWLLGHNSELSAHNKLIQPSYMSSLEFWYPALGLILILK